MSALQKYLPQVILAVSLALLYPMHEWVDTASGAMQLDRDVLYLSDPESVKNLACGYDALLADLYWIRTIQYFGTKVTDDPTVLNERSQKLKLLYPLADIATTLDPQYSQVYQFSGFFVHDYVDPELGYKLLEKGVANNPENFRLYQTLGFLLWSDSKCDEAARVYKQASEIPDAPPLFKVLSAVVYTQCGDVKGTYRLLKTELENTDDPRVKEVIEQRLVGYQALVEIDLLHQAVGYFRERSGRNPTSLVELIRTVRMPSGPDSPPIQVDATGQPLDPNGVPYLYSATTGEITVNPQSIPSLPKPLVPTKQKSTAGDG